MNSVYKVLRRQKAWESLLCECACMCAFLNHEFLIFIRSSKRSLILTYQESLTLMNHANSPYINTNLYVWVHLYIYKVWYTSELRTMSSSDLYVSTTVMESEKLDGHWEGIFVSLWNLFYVPFWDDGKVQSSLKNWLMRTLILKDLVFLTSTLRIGWWKQKRTKIIENSQQKVALKI